MSKLFDGLGDVFRDTFGQPVTLMPLGGPALDVLGIFTERPVDALGTVVADASLHLRNADVGRLTDDHEVIVDGTVYALREPRPDGFGMTAYTLERLR